MILTKWNNFALSHVKGSTKTISYLEKYVVLNLSHIDTNESMDNLLIAVVDFETK